MALLLAMAADDAHVPAAAAPAVPAGAGGAALPAGFFDSAAAEREAVLGKAGLRAAQQAQQEEEQRRQQEAAQQAEQRAVQAAAQDQEEVLERAEKDEYQYMYARGTSLPALCTPHTDAALAPFPCDRMRMVHFEALKGRIKRKLEVPEGVLPSAEEAIDPEAQLTAEAREKAGSGGIRVSGLAGPGTNAPPSPQLRESAVRKRARAVDMSLEALSGSDSDGEDLLDWRLKKV